MGARIDRGEGLSDEVASDYERTLSSIAGPSRRRDPLATEATQPCSLRIALGFGDEYDKERWLVRLGSRRIS